MTIWNDYKGFYFCFLLLSSLLFTCARVFARVRPIAQTQAREKMCVLTFVNTVFCLSGIDVTPRINHGN